MFNPITTIVACLRRFAARREGNTAIIFGLAAIPVVIAAGMAVDVTRAYTVKERLSAALDAASLAVGSEGNLTNTQLQTELQNFFAANYPATALGRNVTVTPIPPSGQPTASLTATVVNYQAQATVDMSFMQLVGVSSITVTATAQTHRGYGLEVALVLDNTGSMLCGPNDGAPAYTDGQCSGSVNAADTNCTNPANQSRICTLRNASLQFLTTMTTAITSSGQLYIGVVPYVTTVNIGSLFCTGGFSCTNMNQDSACSNDFTDVSGNIVTFPNGVLGTLVNGSKAVTGLTNNPGTTGDASAGMPVRGVDPDGGTTTPAALANGTTIFSVLPVSPAQPTSLTLSANASMSGSEILQVGFVGKTTAGSAIVTNISPALSTMTNPLVAGAVVTDNQTSTSAIPGYTVAGPSIPANTAIQSVNPAAGVNQITLCKPATSSGTSTFWTYDAIAYDTTNNNTTENWMGCVIEPTSSNENSGVAGVINSAASNPDVSEPGGGWPSWYPFWWRSGVGGFDSGVNTWTPKAGGILGQSNLTEVQGNVVTDWNKFSGPNQGCPVPILPLQDATTAAGVTAVTNTINSMWPRDAGGTQVAIGMIWGWRMLSANGPFAQNGGHPLSYANQSTLAWKKAVILMTDGSEEWPDANQDTGLSYVSDGKAGSTNLGTASNNLDTRLATVCTNMQNSHNFVIYAIGLGSDGANNSALKNCATTDGGYYTATPTNLNTVFASIAQSLLTLRLSQ